MTEIRETYAAFAARIFDTHPEATIKAVFEIGGCVGAFAYSGNLLIGAFPEKRSTATAAVDPEDA